MKGIVVCPQPRAADVGAQILSAGGNAFDAALATAFAQMVVDPFMCGLGGMGSFQFFHAQSGENGMIDFHARAGSLVTADMWAADAKGRTEISGYTLFDDFRSELGYTAILTPGTVAGFGEVHERFCTLPLDALVAPAARLARDGSPIGCFAHDFLSRPMMPGVPGGLQRVSATEECKRIHLHPQGRIYNVGETHRNPDMARTFERIAAQGAGDFYRGELAAHICRDLAANGSFVTADDLATYKTRVGDPVKGTYRDFEVSSNPPPGSGVTLIQMLQILEHFDLAAMGHGSAAHLDVVARAMAAAHADRNRYLADPEFSEVPVGMLASKERAAHWAEKIKAGEFLGDGKQEPHSCTTHISICDELGNAVSCTHTLGTGAGVVTPGLGFVYNNSMKLFDPYPGSSNSIEAGKARTTGMVPTMLFRDGKPAIVVGAPGGSVIISAVLQSILNIVDFAMSPLEAVTVPRIHCEGGAIHAEARIQESVCRQLASMGHEVKQSAISLDPLMSRAHVVQISPDGSWRGGADPRGGGGMAIVH
ncbi:MAG: gamma-glutamyltranspeptidase/glutathione hydrolase [Gammaproteobacteria bacterium]|jgi:gamma-glutamyltranspeptidase/glutathione hydrolase